MIAMNFRVSTDFNSKYPVTITTPSEIYSPRHGMANVIIVSANRAAMRMGRPQISRLPIPNRCDPNEGNARHGNPPVSQP